jgi:hypothetical protein
LSFIFPGGVVKWCRHLSPPLWPTLAVTEYLLSLDFETVAGNLVPCLRGPVRRDAGAYDGLGRRGQETHSGTVNDLYYSATGPRKAHPPDALDKE